MSLFRPAPPEEQFYARALAVLTRPGRAVRTVAALANAAFYLALTCSIGFVGEQLWDRSQAPVTILRTWADPHVVVAGSPVRQWVELVRHRRCTYATTWTVTDSTHMVHAFGPVVRVAPGDAGPLPQPPFGIEFATPAGMAPGPATLRVSLRGECPENVLDDWWPRTVDMPAVEFEAVARPVPPHDAAPGVTP